MKKRKNPDRPICLYGKYVFEFFNNSDEEFKARSLRSLSKEIRKNFNVSCLPIEEFMVENPERGALIIGICATNLEKGKEVLGEVEAYFDTHAPARIVDQRIEEADII